MSESVNIKPTPEVVEALFDLYVENESKYPKVDPPRTNLLQRLIILFWFIINLVPTTLFLLLRLPFIIIRKIRIRALKQKGKRRFEENYASDPDNWREYIFEKPKLKSTRYDRSLDQGWDDIKVKKAEIEAKLEAAPNQRNNLIDYAVYESVENRELGSKTALFILDQLKNQPEDDQLNKGMLYWNLAVMCNKLKLYNQFKHYEKIALEKGYRRPKMKMNHRAWFALARESWNYLNRDIINCWPS